MRAAFITRYGDNSVVGCGQVADPIPGANKALIEVRAAGTNPVEIAMRRGTSRLRFPSASRRSWVTTLRVWSPRHPRTPRSRQAMRSTLGYPTAGLALMPNSPLFPWASWPANPDLFPLKKRRVFRRSH
jgi:hypothetical protein